MNAAKRCAGFANKIECENGFPKTHMVKKTGQGHCSEQQLLAQRPSMINQAREVFCRGEIPSILNNVLIVSPSPAVPPTRRFPLVILP